MDRDPGPGTPSRQHRHHVQKDLAETLRPLARDDCVELVTGRVKAPSPIAQWRTALMHAGFERSDPRGDRTQQTRTRLSGRGRCDIASDVAQLLQLGDECGALTIVV